MKAGSEAPKVSKSSIILGIISWCLSTIAVVLLIPSYMLYLQPHKASSDFSMVDTIMTVSTVLAVFGGIISVIGLILGKMKKIVPAIGCGVTLLFFIAQAILILLVLVHVMS